jgi:hypothetical protein
VRLTGSDQRALKTSVAFPPLPAVSKAAVTRAKDRPPAEKVPAFGGSPNQRLDARGRYMLQEGEPRAATLHPSIRGTTDG